MDDRPSHPLERAANTERIEIADQLRAYADAIARGEAMPAEVVYADPAWRFKANKPDAPPGDPRHGRNPSRHYRTMPLPEICALPVKQVIAPNAMCGMWVTGPFLAAGLHVQVLRAWGFKPSSIMFSWVKLKKTAPGLFLDRLQDMHFGQGLTTRKNCEWIVLGVRGRSLRVAKNIPEVGLFPRMEHSRKPEEFRQRIEEYVGPGRVMLELFGRTAIANWTVLGDEVGKFRLAA